MFVALHSEQKRYFMDGMLKMQATFQIILAQLLPTLFNCIKKKRFKTLIEDVMYKDYEVSSSPSKLCSGDIPIISSQENKSQNCQPIIPIDSSSFISLKEDFLNSHSNGMNINFNHDNNTKQFSSSHNALTNHHQLACDNSSVRFSSSNIYQSKHRRIIGNNHVGKSETSFVSLDDSFLVYESPKTIRNQIEHMERRYTIIKEENLASQITTYQLECKLDDQIKLTEELKHSLEQKQREVDEKRKIIAAKESLIQENELNIEESREEKERLVTKVCHLEARLASIEHLNKETTPSIKQYSSTQTNTSPDDYTCCKCKGIQPPPTKNRNNGMEISSELLNTSLIIDTPTNKFDAHFEEYHTHFNKLNDEMSQTDKRNLELTKQNEALSNALKLKNHDIQEMKDQLDELTAQNVSLLSYKMGN